MWNQTSYNNTLSCTFSASRAFSRFLKESKVSCLALSSDEFAEGSFAVSIEASLEVSLALRESCLQPSSSFFTNASFSAATRSTLASFSRVFSNSYHKNLNKKTFCLVCADCLHMDAWMYNVYISRLTWRMVTFSFLASSKLILKLTSSLSVLLRARVISSTVARSLKSYWLMLEDIWDLKVVMVVILRLHLPVAFPQ